MAVETIDVRKEARKIARQLRERFRARGEFTQTAFRQALHGELRHMEGDAYEAMVDKIADDVDRDSTREQSRDQPALPGMDFDLDGEYRLGDGRRVAKRRASREHAQMALSIDIENLIAVQEANTRKHKEFLALSPYWSDGMTKEQAVAAYHADHAQSES